MKYTTYDIYVDGVFSESWETEEDAVKRAMNIERELGRERIIIVKNDGVEES